jgi:hypothetical protein
MRGIEPGFSVRMFAVACCAMLLVTLPHEVMGGSRGKGEPIPAANIPSKDLFRSIPADYFIENAGQLSNQDVRFYATSGDMQMGFAESAVLIKIVERSPAAVIKSPQDRELIHSPPPEPVSSRGVLLRLDFEGANRVTPQGRDPLPHPTNFFIGNDPTRWRTGVRSFREIIYEDLYDGIDLVYRLGPNGLKYDFLVNPVADPRSIRMAYEGIKSLNVNPTSLVLGTAVGNVWDDDLVATAGGESVQCAFARVEFQTAGFDCMGWNGTHTLVIDPLVWSTYLGGGSDDYARALVLDAAGNPIVAGYTASADFPTTPGVYDFTFNGGFHDAFVVKLSADGSSLLWATYLGGGIDDLATSLVLDGSGNPVVAGYTESADFPTTPGAYDVTFNGGFHDGFVVKLSADGSSLLWATYLGGDDYDWLEALVLDNSGNPVAAGCTTSSDFPTTPGAYKPIFSGTDAFTAKLSADGSSLLWATYLGGDNWDQIWALSIDASGNPVAAGRTISSDFPATPGAYDATYGGYGDAFVVKLSADGSSLLWATYLGGDSNDLAYALVLDSSGNPVVAGYTESWDFPATSGAYDVALGNFCDAFVAKLSTDGSSLLWATYLGGSASDWAEALVLDNSGNPVVAGYTNFRDFPAIPGAYDKTYNGEADGFVAELKADGSNITWATYLGGSSGDWDEVYAIALSTSGYAVVAGNTDSVDFPATLGAYDVTYNGADDAFVAKLELTLDLSPPTVTIASPVDGSVIGGTSAPISGVAADVGSGLDRVEVSCDGGTTWEVAAGTSTWAYTCTGLLAGPHEIHARSFDLVGWESLHDNITINVDPTPPTVFISSPSGGETWIQGGSHPVTWTASDNEDAQSALIVWINYTSGVGSGNICGPVAGNLGSCTWILPVITAMDVVVNATVIDTGGLKGYDESGEFTIRTPPPPNIPPTVTITSPIGEEEFLKGSSQTITWTMTDDTTPNANLTIYINYTTGGVTSPIVAALKGQVSFAWALPNIEANDVVVNITVIDSGGLKGWSQSGPFAIKTPPSPPPDFLSQYWWLIVIIVAVVIVLLLLALMKRRRPKEEEEEVLSSEPHIPPPSE